MEPYQFFAPIPATTVTSADLASWLFQRRSQVKALVVNRGPHSDYDGDTMELLLKKLQSLDSSLATSALTPAQVVQNLQTWLGQEKDHGVWNYYVNDQLAKDDRERQRQRGEDEAQRLTRAKNDARVAAGQVAGENSHGMLSSRESEQPVGRVIAGLALIGQPGVTYRGISGVDKHLHATHALVSALLAGTQQAEAWPVASCAEVDALKRFLHAQQPPLAAIPADTLVFHAMVWHPGGKWGGKETTARWQDRSACKNCAQWFSKIGAIRA